MKSRQIATVVAAVFAVRMAAQTPAVRLWAVSDGVRVNPVTGKVFEERQDIHKDYPAGDFRAANSVWNAKAKTVSLKAARNEFVSFQAIVETAEPLRDVNVHFPGLAGPNGVRIDGNYAALFKEWYVQVRHATTGYERSSLGPGWYPDALLPQRRSHLESGLPFSIPDLYNNIPDQKNQALWIDLFVPDDRKAAPPGHYTGDIEVTWKGGTRQRSCGAGCLGFRAAAGKSHTRRYLEWLHAQDAAR